VYSARSQGTRLLALTDRKSAQDRGCKASFRASARCYRFTPARSGTPRGGKTRCAGAWANRHCKCTHGDTDVERRLVLQSSRLDAKRRRFLQGMLRDKHELSSLTITSPTFQFERDRMLYYKAIQETSVAPLDFITTLRKSRPRPDETCTRNQQLQQAKKQFSASVTSKQVRRQL
jgi:hypothetical protein